MADVTRLTDALDNGGVYLEATRSTARPVGTIIRDSTNGKLYVSTNASSAQYEPLASFDSVLTAAPAVIGGSTAEAAFASSYEIPADLLVAGTVISFQAVVTAVATVSTDTLTCRVRLGGVAGTQIVTSGAVDVADNDIWIVKGQIVIRTAGASGTMFAAGSEILDAPGTATESWVLQSTAVDTTAALDMVVTAEWSTTNANEARLDQLNVALG